MKARTKWYIAGATASMVAWIIPLGLALVWHMVWAFFVAALICGGLIGSCFFIALAFNGEL